MSEQNYGHFRRGETIRTATSPKEAVKFRFDGWEEVELVDVEIPPRVGKGSSREAWAAYAEASGVEVPEDATRQDVIDALEKAGVATGDAGED
jgi:hypothetical protein